MFSLRWPIVNITSDKRVAAVVGLAGESKSALLEAARQAWEVGE